MTPPPYTGNGLADVRAYRDAHGCSLREALRAVRKRRLLERIADVNSFGEMRDVLREIVESTYQL